ncbi:hypothetical protein O1M63_52810 [Streptomyces mirabilis]|nr:hypothetical protein [Streptomyces mirabilis]
MTGTTRRRATTSRASTARCLGPFSASARPSLSATVGPSTPNATRTLLASPDTLATVLRRRPADHALSTR